MFDLLQKHIARYVTIDEQELQPFFESLTHKKLRKNQYLLQEGEICKSDYFVIAGGLRQYQVDNKDREHVIHFGFPDWWIADRYSQITQTPSNYFIQAQEPTEVFQIRKKTLDELYRKIPKLESYFHKVLQQAYATEQGRILLLQQSAKERYKGFLKHYGHIEQKLSQQHIASYLGITRETLSRIRSQSVKKYSKT